MWKDSDVSFVSAFEFSHRFAARFFIHEHVSLRPLILLRDACVRISASGLSILRQSDRESYFSLRWDGVSDIQQRCIGEFEQREIGSPKEATVLTFYTQSHGFLEVYSLDGKPASDAVLKAVHHCSTLDEPSASRFQERASNDLQAMRQSNADVALLRHETKRKSASRAPSKSNVQLALTHTRNADVVINEMSKLLGDMEESELDAARGAARRRQMLGMPPPSLIGHDPQSPGKHQNNGSSQKSPADLLQCREDSPDTTTLSSDITASLSLKDTTGRSQTVVSNLNSDSVQCISKSIPVDRSKRARGEWAEIWSDERQKYYYFSKDRKKTQWSAVGTPFESDCRSSSPLQQVDIGTEAISRREPRPILQRKLPSVDDHRSSIPYVPVVATVVATVADDRNEPKSLDPNAQVLLSKRTDSPSNLLSTSPRDYHAPPLAPTAKQAPHQEKQAPQQEKQASPRAAPKESPPSAPKAPPPVVKAPPPPPSKAPPSRVATAPPPPVAKQPSPPAPPPAVPKVLAASTSPPLPPEPPALGADGPAFTPTPAAEPRKIDTASRDDDDKAGQTDKKQIVKDGWKRMWNAGKNKFYYVEVATKKSTWKVAETPFANGDEGGVPVNTDSVSASQGSPTNTSINESLQKDGWKRMWDEGKSKFYYVEIATKKSTWKVAETPFADEESTVKVNTTNGSVSQGPSSPGEVNKQPLLMDGWKRMWNDAKGKFYYVEVATKKSTWKVAETPFAGGEEGATPVGKKMKLPIPASVSPLADAALQKKGDSADANLSTEPVMKDGWKRMWNEMKGKFYYVEVATKRSTWKVAETPFGKQMPEIERRGDWEKVYDANKDKFFFRNTATKATTWKSSGTPFE